MHKEITAENYMELVRYEFMYTGISINKIKFTLIHCSKTTD